MLGRGRVGRPGVLGGRPVARTAAVAGKRVHRHLPRLCVLRLEELPVLEPRVFDDRHMACEVTG